MRRLFKREEGFTLAWLAMILFLLLAMAGFGTDLGWIYLNSVRTQNAADAAALAGVVNLPGFDPAPDAESAARANGYDPGGADTLALTPTAENELHAELSTSIEPFFMRVLGFTQFDITRESTARYIKPVPLGSPSNCFGGGGSAPPCSGSEDFWAAVSGRHTLLEDGDPYSTLCDINSPCDNANPNYRRAGAYSGYYYGVEVQPGTTNLQVQIFNGAFDQGGATGDSNVTGGGGAIDATFTLYRPDTTPLIPQDHVDGTATPVCSLDSASASNGWSQLCSTIGNPTSGIWLVHVESTTNAAGSNNFAIRAEGSIAPRVYGMNDMSIWSDDLVGASDLYLAEIVEEHAGKKLELAFYDAGDAFAESWYRVRDPSGDIPTCTWTVWSADYPLPSASQLDSGGPGPCVWQTQENSPTGHQGFFNKEWIVAVIDLPVDPDDMCAGTGPAACFWKMELDLSDPTERTTWRARVIGNPVQLIPTPSTTNP
jgi:hypothetical protein